MAITFKKKADATEQKALTPTEVDELLKKEAKHGYEYLEKVLPSNEGLPIPTIELSPEEKKHRQSYQRLYALPDHIRTDLDSMVYDEDVSAADIARKLQNTYNVLTNITVSTLSQQIHKYRSDLKSLAKMKKMSSEHIKRIRKGKAVKEGTKTTKEKELEEEEKHAYKLLKKLNSNVDVVHTLEETLAIQWQRVQKLKDVEKNMPLTMDKMGKEIKLFSELLSQLSRLQMDTGILRKIDPKLRVQFELPEELRNYEARVQTTRTLQYMTIKALDIINGNGSLEGITEEDLMSGLDLIDGEVIDV